VAEFAVLVRVIVGMTEHGSVFSFGQDRYH